ncbi:MAG: tetratricopeptide repeat protein, partial [Bacteroidia bacterium]
MKAGALQIILLLIFLFPSAQMFCMMDSNAKRSVPDSLHQLLSAEKNDSLRKEYIIKLAYYYLDSKPDSALYYANTMTVLGEKTHDQNLIARAFTILGVECENRGDYKKALNYYLDGLKICEKAANEKGAADINNNIGLVFLDMGNYQLALEYYNKFLQYSIKINNKKNIGDAYNNIGIVYCSQGQLDTCLEYQLKAINLKKETGDKKGLATSLDNIGLIYLNKGKKEECLLYFSESLKIREELNDQLGMCITYLNISEAYIQQKEFKRAEEYAEKDLEMAKKLNSKVYERHGYLALAQIHYKMNDFKKAYDYYYLYSAVKDSILNEANSKNMQELQTRYESEKKDNEIRLLNKDNLVKESDLKKQQILNWSIGAGLIITIISSVIVFRSYREKKKANVLLEEKNSAIHEQNQIISEKKKEIEDSINYARYIQRSILPDPELFKNHFKDSLLLFIPKDIVSGDFYFLHASSGEKTIWVGAVDCTGHGVPGGFMSVIGAEAFKQGVNEELSSPAKV